jgi:glutamine synthetase
MKVKAERLRLLYPDLHGLDRGKYVYSEDRARANFCLGVYPLTLDREIIPVPGLQFDVGLPDMEAYLDETTLRPGWEPDTAVGIADVRFRGRPIPVDPREALRRAVEPWTAMGLVPQLGYEYEFYLLEPDGEGGWREMRTPGARVYGTGMAVDPHGVVDDIVRTARRSGFHVEAYNSEYDTPQFEINLRYQEAVPAADAAFLFRVLAREVAARRGFHCTFLGRPFGDRSGSGLHLNISFRREDGSNALVDAGAPDGLSGLARRCIAGLLAHHEGLTAVCAPHVNAYKRLQPGLLAGYWANWGYDDRTVTVRVSHERGATTRLEHRVPDAASNPYLVGAVLLHAARLGVEGGLEAPPPQPTGKDPNTDRKVPPSLEEALDTLEADRELVAALGTDLVTAFTMIKRAEWERYVRAVDDPATTDVTPWELQYYLPFF